MHARWVAPGCTGNDLRALTIVLLAPHIQRARRTSQCTARVDANAKGIRLDSSAVTLVDLVPLDVYESIHMAPALAPKSMW